LERQQGLYSKTWLYSLTNDILPSKVSGASKQTEKRFLILKDKNIWHDWASRRWLLHLKQNDSQISIIIPLISSQYFQAIEYQ
jgi:hypothetical protein